VKERFSEEEIIDPARGRPFFSRRSEATGKILFALSHPIVDGPSSHALSGHDDWLSPIKY
jgi:hypothetical protein